jgi:hypothetical protein
VKGIQESKGGDMVSLWCAQLQKAKEREIFSNINPGKHGVSYERYFLKF